MSTDREKLENLERKLEITTQLVEMLEQRISASDKISQQKEDDLEEKEHQIRKLQEELEREKRRPAQVTQPSDDMVRQIDISKLSAAELMIHAEQLGIPWGKRQKSR